MFLGEILERLLDHWFVVPFVKLPVRLPAVNPPQLMRFRPAHQAPINPAAPIRLQFSILIKEMPRLIILAHAHTSIGGASAAFSRSSIV